MDISLHRRRLIASMALGPLTMTMTQAQTTTQPAPAAAPATAAPTVSTATPAHPDLALKLIIVGRRKPGTTLAEHRHHIRHVHGELVLQNIAVDPQNAPRRYVQNPVIDGSFRATKPGTDPFALNRDFVTQIWFPDLPSLGRARQSAFYLEKLKGDEDNFVDQATVVFMPVRERVQAERRTPTANSVKLFGLLQRAPGAAPEDFRRAWSAAPWGAGAAVAKLQRHVQNDTLPTPAGPPALDGIDEFWFDDEASARSFLKQWQAWVADTLVRPGLLADTGHFALIAQEHVLFAGPR